MLNFNSKQVTLSQIIVTPIQTGFQVRGGMRIHGLNPPGDKTASGNIEQKLKDIDSSISGPVARGGAGKEAGATFQAERYNLIQTKDVKRGILYQIKKTNLDTLFIPVGKSKFMKKYLTKKNDVLYLSKLNPGAFRYIGPVGDTIPTAHFYILRPKTDYADPDYLCWALNQNFTIRHYVQKHLIGSALPFISRTDLVNFKIPLPIMSVQKKIISLLKLREREKLFQKTIDEKKHLLINTVLRKLL